MLKKNIIFVVFAFLAMFDMVVAAPSFASNEQGDKAEVAAGAGKTDDAHEEVGLSGSYLSSQFSRSNGDIESATESLQTVYEKNQENTEIANQLMGLYLLGGKVDKAMEIASHIAKMNPKDPIAALMLSLQAIKRNDAPAASHILDGVFEEEGGQLWLPLISAWLDVEQHKLRRPLVMEELSAEVGRAAPIVNYHLALINGQAGFTAAAAENFKLAIEDPMRAPPRVMQMLLQFYEKNKSPEILKPIVTAYKAANRNPPKVKVPLINNMKDGSAEILFTMGSIMLSADVTQDATLYLQLALYLKPDMEIATIALAQAYSDMQQYGIANQLLAKMPGSSPLYNSAQLYMAINLGHLKKTDEALGKLDEIIAASPNSIDAYMAKGDLLRAQERYGEAIAVYESAIATLKEAKAQHWPIYFAIATCLDKQGKWAEAEKKLKRSIELSPNQPDVLNYYGYSLLLRNENLQLAREMIEKALKKRPTDAQIQDSMGWVLYMAGDYKRSVVYLESAVSQLPADATVNDHLGDVYWRLGRKTEARFQWDRSLTYAKDENLQQELKNKMKEGLPENRVEAGGKKSQNIPVTASVID